MEEAVKFECAISLTAANIIKDMETTAAATDDKNESEILARIKRAKEIAATAINNKL